MAKTDEGESCEDINVSDLLQEVNLYAEERKAVIFEHYKQTLREKLFNTLARNASALSDNHKDVDRPAEEIGQRQMELELEEVALQKMLTLLTTLSFTMEIKNDTIHI